MEEELHYYWQCRAHHYVSPLYYSVFPETGEPITCTLPLNHEGDHEDHSRENLGEVVTWKDGRYV